MLATNSIHPNSGKLSGTLRNFKPISTEVFEELQCSHFIPKSQTVCHCGLEYKEHTTDAIHEYSRSNTQELHWTSERSTSKRETRSRGALLTYRHGVIRESLYLRLSFKSEPAKVFSYLRSCWDIQKLPPVSFIVHLSASSEVEWSVSQRKRVAELVLSVLSIENVLIVVNGIHTELTDVLGRCVDKYWIESGRETRILGVCLWGVVMESEDLIKNQHVAAKNSTSHYHIDSKPDVGKYWLHSSVTDFLLVDDGTCLNKDTRVSEFIAAVLTQFASEVSVAHLVFDDSPYSISTVDSAAGTSNQRVYIPNLDSSDSSNVMYGCLEMVNTLPFKTEGNVDALKRYVSKSFKGYRSSEDLERNFFHLLINNSENRKRLSSVDFDVASDKFVSVMLNEALEEIKDPFVKLRKCYNWNKASVCEDVCVMSNLDSNQENEAVLEVSKCLIDGKALFCRMYVSFNLLDFDYFGSEERLCKLYKEVFCSKEQLVLSRYFSKFFPSVFQPNIHHNLELSDVANLYKFLKSLSEKVSFDVKMIFEGVAEERRIKNPMRELFIFSLLTEKYELAEEMWVYLPNKITTSLFAAALITQIKLAFLKRKLRLQQNFEAMDQAASKFESKAAELIDFCHKRDPDRTGACMKIKYPDWANVDMAGFAQKCESGQEFLATDACSHFTRQRWFYNVHPDESQLKVTICSLLPFLCALLILDCEDSPEDSWLFRLKNGRSVWQRTIRFYRSPITIFALNQLYNLVFVVLFGVMICEGDLSEVTVLEIFVLSYALVQLLEKVRYMILFRVSGPLNWSRIPLLISMAGYLLLFAAFVLQVVPEKREHIHYVRIIYVFSFCLFACKCFQIFVLSRFLAPKLVILQQMLPDLFHFSLIMALFSLIYGTASFALTQSHVDSSNFMYGWLIVLRPMLQLFGDLYIDDSNLQMSCGSFSDSPVSNRCLPEGNETETVMAIVLTILYLTVVTVLLITWLVAVFVNKYRKLSSQAYKLLLIQQYFLVQEYFEKSAVPPPFAIISFVVFWLKAIFKQKLPDGSDFTRAYKHNLTLIPELIQWESCQISDLLRIKKAQKSNHLFESTAPKEGRTSEQSQRFHFDLDGFTQSHGDSSDKRSYEKVLGALEQQGKQLDAIKEQLSLTQVSIQNIKSRKSTRSHERDLASRSTKESELN